jgi:hypothetical protein
MRWRIFLAGVQCVRFVEADLIVPDGGPRPAIFAGEPEAVRGFDQVIADGSRHGGDYGFGFPPCKAAASGRVMLRSANGIVPGQFLF